MSHADWSKLTIPLDEVDLERALAYWRWLVDRPFRPIVLTRFGDWFGEVGDGGIYRLDILEGAFTSMCASAAEFAARRDEDQQLVDWFQDGMVYAMYAAGSVPGRGQGFGYAVPPILGGELGRDNVVVVGMNSWQMFTGQLHQQLQALPPGARITGIDVSDDGLVQVRHTTE
jgi:type VI secretion system (T6SS) immunity protein Tdi1